jgi:putative FmdB family regulatory protein
MPVYDYECRDCGVFTALRPMSDCKASLACPTCGVDAVRTFHTAPAIAGMDAAKRAAVTVNERSAHEPRISGGRHGAGCSCCSRKGNDNAARPANAHKSFPKTRPWMISH